jgi:hypothetical protein
MSASMLPVLRRHCDDCRHDRSTSSLGDRWTPPDYEPGCAVLDDDALPSGAGALRRYAESGTYDRIVEHGGCPTWEPWTACSSHGLPAHPAHGCDECIREYNQAESEAAAW